MGQDLIQEGDAGEQVQQEPDDDEDEEERPEDGRDEVSDQAHGPGALETDGGAGCRSVRA